jgi:hypothetical protein
MEEVNNIVSSLTEPFKGLFKGTLEGGKIGGSIVGVLGVAATAVVTGVALASGVALAAMAPYIAIALVGTAVGSVMAAGAGAGTGALAGFIAGMFNGLRKIAAGPEKEDRTPEIQQTAYQVQSLNDANHELLEVRDKMAKQYGVEKDENGSWVKRTGNEDQMRVPLADRANVVDRNGAAPEI